MKQENDIRTAVTVSAPNPAYVVLSDGIRVSYDEFRQNPRMWLDRD